MCPHCRAFITTKDRVCPYCETKVGPRAVERRSPPDLAGFVPQARFTTSMILLINISLYIATALYSARQGDAANWMSIDGRTLVIFGAKWGPAILGYGEWWRLVTAGFLHGGMLHLLMNSWILYDLGATVEELHGAARMVVIYFVSTITGFLASLFWAPMAPSVGASAGLFGLIGAMLALSVRDESWRGTAMRTFYARWVIYMLIIGLLPGLAIDNAAHLGGLAGGFIIAYIAGTPKLVMGPTEYLWRIACVLSLVTTAACFALWWLSAALV